MPSISPARALVLGMLSWLPGTRRGAFAVFVRGSGAAPGPVTRLPFWYLRAVLRLMVRGEQ